LLIFKKKGKKIKKLNDGIIISKVEFVKSITLLIFFVSQYNQINAKKVVKGMETINPPNSEERLDISETTTTIIAVNNVFIIK
tara:strand:+ start:2151 stop:2399 length:249 start_codon:yes stop_codon:yes gene_type:complete